jgi:hypothetical protein
MIYELFSAIAPYLTIAGIVGSSLFFLVFFVLVAFCCIQKAKGKCFGSDCRC